MSDKFRKSLLSSSLETTPPAADCFSHAEELARGSQLKDHVS